MEFFLHNKYWNIFLLSIFFVISVITVIVGTHYKTTTSKMVLDNTYHEIASSFTNKLEILIGEKKNTTLTIGLSLAEDLKFKQAIQNKTNIHDLLYEFSNKLSLETDFKNVWIQIVDDKGTVISRSWTDDCGDNLKKVRFDVTSIINHPVVLSSVSVGKYDLSFKAMIPFFDNTGKYLGYLEVITHFNSIVEKLKEEGFETIVLVDKSYKKQLIYPFTSKFIGEYYVANKNADEDILNYISKAGIEDVLSYKENYALEDTKKYLRVNYTLFTSNNTPMAYVLMFKKLESINTATITNRNLLINIFMVFSIVVVAFILLLLANNEHIVNDEKNNNMKYIVAFFSFFVIVTLIYYLLLNSYRESEQAQALKQYNANIQKDYQIINAKFQAVAETMFETTLNNQAVLNLVAKAYTYQKDEARAALFELLKGDYEYFKRYDVRQLHFHLKNNESFLRFHRPEKYGDDLTGIRQTVEWVNTKHKSIEGFEEGRIYNGFRYVYPLVYFNQYNKREYLGSVEVSFSVHSFAKEFVDSHHAKVGFIIEKNVVKTKVFNEEKENYMQSELEGFYYEKAIKKQLEMAFTHFEIEKIPPKEIVQLHKKVLEGKIFSVLSQDKSTLFTFIPLQNPISKKIVAAIILQIDNEILSKQNDFFVLLFLIGATLIMLMSVFIFREYSQKIKFLDLSLKTQQILNAQKSIVIITDGKHIFDTNKTFLEFFAYETLEKFKIDHDCICEFFIENENYFHLAKVPKGKTWIEVLGTILDKEKVVLMKDSEGIEHSFAITFNSYKSSYFIVTFVDISGTMQEQITLGNKVLHDKLTGVYNREFFEIQVEKIREQNYSNSHLLGVILFDIDHFKTVNDTFGHNVGDNVLKELAQRVERSIRTSDYLIRWGGEEFIILMTAKSSQEVEKTAQHLCSMIEHHFFEDVKKVTCSFGVTLHLPNESIKATVQRADKALYASKKNGRNQVTAL
jgi:diguanylate cyclase (GGDEF)-like protein